MKLGLQVVITLAACGSLAACGGDPAPSPTPSLAPTSAAVPPDSARAQLAARVTAGEDHKVSAVYTLTEGGSEPRSVVATTAHDGSWRVDIAGGAMGGLADVAVAANAGGLYQCALTSARRPVAPVCIRITDADGKLPKHIDPRVQHAFTDWPDVLIDRQAPISVSISKQLSGVSGQCFAVESTYASLDSPLDPGIYCYREDGVLTGAKLSFGTLVLAGDPAAGPASVALPGPVEKGPALGMNTPAPQPVETQSATPSGGTASAAAG